MLDDDALDLVGDIVEAIHRVLEMIVNLVSDNIGQPSVFSSASISSCLDSVPI